MIDRQNNSFKNSLTIELNLSNSHYHSNINKSLSNKIRDTEDSFSLDNLSFNKFRANLKELKDWKLFPYSEINDHFICKNCKNIPIINFTSLENVDYSCSCCKVNNKEIKNIIYENIIKENEENEEEKNNDTLDSQELENYLKCKKHKKIFLYYCKTCEENICRECLREKYFHQYHNIFFFDLYLFEMDYQIDQIYKILMNKYEESKLDFNIIDPFIYLLSVIFNDYLFLPNYSHFQIILNAYKFLEKYMTDINNNKNIENFGLKKEIIINKKKDFNFHIFHNPEMVIEIDINKSNFNCSDISLLFDLNFINLKKLRLKENNIVNIQKLKNAKFKNIEYISFQNNKLNNDNIPCLLELDFPKLIELDLYLNNFTSYELYKLKNNKKYLPNLESLQIGSNNIDWKIKTINDNKSVKKFNFDSIKSLGLTNGVFDSNTISVIENFYFEKLEKIYLSRNNLDSLSFVEKLKAPELREIYLHTCFLKEYFHLIKFKKLESIYIYDNYINEINNLESFVDNLPKLIKLVMSGNDIDINNEKNREILKSVKNKRKNLNIII